MENAENFSDGKGITKPKEKETVVKYEWSKIPLDSCGSLITMYKKHLEDVIAKEGFTINSKSGV